MKHATLYETHIRTKEINKAISFYQGLQLEVAHVIPERKVAFFWLGDYGKKDHMLGIWEVQEDQFKPAHFAFGLEYENLLRVPDFLDQLGVKLTPDFGLDTSEPIVHPWMPAASYYFSDPDGNSLEYISVLEDKPRKDLPAMHLSKWLELKDRE